MQFNVQAEKIGKRTKRKSHFYLHKWHTSLVNPISCLDNYENDIIIIGKKMEKAI